MLRNKPEPKMRNLIRCIIAKNGLERIWWMESVWGIRKVTGR